MRADRVYAGVRVLRVAAAAAKDAYRRVRDTAAYAIYHQEHELGRRFNRRERAREYFLTAVDLTACLLRFDVYGRLVCRFRGHGDVEVEEFVNAERDALGRITDIDGGGVDWYCKRCGQGGRSYL